MNIPDNLATIPESEINPSQKTGSSYLVNYRYSTLEVFNKLGIVLVCLQHRNIRTSPKVQHPDTKAGIFSLGIGGISKLSPLDSDLKQVRDWSYIKRRRLLYIKQVWGAVVGFQIVFFTLPAQTTSTAAAANR